MAWDKELETLADVPEYAKSFYKEVKDGDKTKYVLEEIDPLKNALKHAKTERDQARAKAKQIEAWEKLGKSPEEIEQMLADATKKAEEEARKAGDFDGILKQHQTKWEKDLEAAKAEAGTWKGQYISTHVNTNLLSALAAGEATPEGIEVLPQILQSRVKAEAADGKVTVTILDGSGAAMAGGGADGKATFADLVKEAKAKYPSLFKGTGQSGSGASNGSGKGSGAGNPGNLKRSTMNVAAKAKYIEEHGQAEFLKLPWA